MKDLLKIIEPLTKNEKGQLMGGFSKIETKISESSGDVENGNCHNDRAVAQVSIENMNCRNACSCGKKS